MSKNPKSVVIVSARRTPQGRFLGALLPYSCLDLAVVAAKAALDGISPEKIDMVIMGNVLPPVLNVARQASLKLGIPQEATAFTVNMACASGLQAIVLARNAILLGDAEVVLCGGTESMSNAPHFLPRARTGYRLENGELVDSVLLGLSDPAIGEQMPQTAERLAEMYKIGRGRQDAFALRSHRSAGAAQKAGRFDREIVTLPELEKDEHVREDSSLERLAKLKPVLGANGTVSAGNASGINDGASMLVLTSEEVAQRNGWKPMARMTAATSTGCDPRIMGIGPVHAIRKICEQQKCDLSDFDAIEINEAFAAQALACATELKIGDDEERFNRHGSGIALGHPIGASAARLAVHLAHEVARGDVRRGLASVCIGGGMGIASIIEAFE